MQELFAGAQYRYMYANTYLGAGAGPRHKRCWYTIFLWVCHHFAHHIGQACHFSSVKATGDSCALLQSEFCFMQRVPSNFLPNVLHCAFTQCKQTCICAHVVASSIQTFQIKSWHVDSNAHQLAVLQVESTVAMQNIAPRVKAIQEEYKGRDQQEMQIKVGQLYKEAGINPLAGCLPTLATLPVWIGLYR